MHVDTKNPQWAFTDSKIIFEVKITYVILKSTRLFHVDQNSRILQNTQQCVSHTFFFLSINNCLKLVQNIIIVSLIDMCHAWLKSYKCSS